MKCQNHPDKESTGICVVCGKSVCDECKLSVGGKNYCKECINEMISSNEEANPNPQNEQESKTSNNTKSNKNISKNESDNSIEEKYEKYLDDLYNDEVDEPHDTYVPKDRTKSSNENKISETPTNKSQIKNKKYKMNNMQKEMLDTEYKASSLHKNIHKKKNQENESTNTEIVLLIILIVMIILVISYVIFLFTLSDQYVSFFEAVYQLFANPNEVINNMFS